MHLESPRAPLPVVSAASPPPGQHLHVGPIVPRPHTLRDAAGTAWVHGDLDTLRRFIHFRDLRRAES